MPVYSYETLKGKRWMYKVSIDGIQFLKRGFTSKALAKKAEYEFMIHPSDKRNFLLSDVTKHFLSLYDTQVKSSTSYATHHFIKNYILSKLVDKNIESYTFSELNIWRSKINKEHLKNKNLVLNILKRIFEHGRIYFNIRNNEDKKLLPFKDFSIKEEFKEERKRYVTLDEFKRIYKSEDNDYFKLYLLVSYFTGMRISEVRGLQVKCFDGLHLFIYQQINSKLGKSKSILTSLKTSNSNRIYLLPKFLIDLLKDHIQNNKLKEKDFIFFSPRSKSRPLNETRFLVEIRKLSSLTGIKFTSHQFRHGEATLLNEEGIEKEKIKDYLGHSSIEVTSKYYIHETDKRRQEIADLLEDKYERYLK